MKLVLRFLNAIIVVINLIDLLKIMNRIRRWIRYKYRPYGWKFWKNLKRKYNDSVCSICTHSYGCNRSVFQQRGCYVIHKKWGDLKNEKS